LLRDPLGKRGFLRVPLGHQPGIASTAGSPATRIGALDGLRAVAVAAVVVYHFSPGLLPSGFLGVDVFMVVSGFIVTNLLLRERQRNGRINVAAFWGRRFRRLVPALVVMVIVVTELVRRLDPPSVAGAARSQGLSALVYLTNWKLVVSGVSYGGAVGSRSPFVHLWSLAVEEQFYLVWPAVLVGLLAISRKRMWPVITVTVVAAVASMAWMAHLYDPAVDPLRVYYGTDTRAQAFLIGAIGAFVLPYLGARSHKVLRKVAPVAFLGVLFAMTTVLARVTWRYRFSRAYRVILLEAGHFCQTFCLVATWLGLAPFCTAAFDDEKIEDDLGLNADEAVLYAGGVGIPLRPD